MHPLVSVKVREGRTNPRMAAPGFAAKDGVRQHALHSASGRATACRQESTLCVLALCRSVVVARNFTLSLAFVTPLSISLQSARVHWLRSPCGLPPFLLSSESGWTCGAVVRGACSQTESSQERPHERPECEAIKNSLI